MRITTGMTADNAIYNLQQQRQTLDSLQEQVSSGLNVNTPSDNPLTTRQLMDLQNQISSGDQYTSNISNGSLALNVASTALDSMSSIMQQVNKLAGDMSSGSSDKPSVTAAVSNLTQFKQQLIDLANTKVGDRYVFGGFSTTPPFDASGNFTGTDDAVNVEIAPSSTVSTSVSGGKLLRGGTPPAAVGSGATAGSSPTDIIGGISALITAISTNNTAGITDGVKNMSAAAQQINDASADVAGRLSRMDNMKNMISNNQSSLKNVYSNLQDVDMAKVGVMLSQQTTAFNAALSTTAKLTQLSLLDYMK